MFYGQGKYDKALEHYQRALNIREKALGPEHPDVASSLSNLGEVFNKQGKYDKALRNYERALAICEKKTCKAGIVPEIRFNLARALWEKGGPSRGRSLTLAERVRDAYSKMEQKKKELLEVEEWLKKRKGPGK
jgi:tetratricopeptide (TPR) repeat protein